MPICFGSPDGEPFLCYSGGQVRLWREMGGE
jgi:hypothetical protein